MRFKAKLKIKARAGRRYGRRRFRRGRGGFRKRVLSVVRSQVETKKFPYTGSVQVYNDGMYWSSPYSGIVAGTAGSQRIGDKISLVGVKYIVTFVPTDQAALGDTRLRLWFSSGTAVGSANGAATFAGTTTVFKDGFLGQPVRNGTECPNSDWCKTVYGKELFLLCTANHVQNRMIGTIQNNTSVTANTDVSTIAYSSTFSGRRMVAYLPLKGRTLNWRSGVASEFSQLVPHPIVYVYNQSLGAGILAGTMYYQCFVYFKDA